MGIPEVVEDTDFPETWEHEEGGGEEPELPIEGNKDKFKPDGW